MYHVKSLINIATLNETFIYLHHNQKRQIMRTAVIFTRVSSTTDRQNTERQISDLSRYAQGLQYDVKEIYSEKISGATKNANRSTLNECIAYCINNRIDILLISEISRLGRNILELQETIKILVDNKINLYSQKEQFTLLDQDTKELSVFAPIMIATLATCASIERDNIKFRLNSGREQFKANGGVLGRKKGSVKSNETILKDHADIVKYLRANKYSIREISKLTGKSTATIQKVKKELNI